MQKLVFEIPDGKEVDWKESERRNTIVLKDKLNYGNITRIAEITNISNGHYFSEHQLNCILAKNKLANVAFYLNEGWKPDASYDVAVITTGLSDNIIVVSVANGSIASSCGSVWFKTEELAQQAIKILGEETIKLALEPLGV